MDTVKILDRYSAGDEFQRPIESAIEEITTLRQRVAELEKEVAHWKNNHETEVRRARILKERTDMPIERVQAYEQWGKDMAERDKATQYWQIAEGRCDALKQQRDELLAAQKKASVVLSGKEIREIAEFAGLQFVEHDYTDEYETEIAIESCPDKGILNDDNAPEHYRLIAFLNEYPEEGCIGLGEKIEAAAIASVKELNSSIANGAR